MLDARLDGAYRSRHGVGPGKCGARVSLAKYRTRRCFAGNDGSWIKFCDRIRSTSLIFVGFAGLTCRHQEEAWSPPTLAIEMQVFRL